MLSTHQAAYGNHRGFPECRLGLAVTCRYWLASPERPAGLPDALKFPGPLRNALWLNSARLGDCRSCPNCPAPAPLLPYPPASRRDPGSPGSILMPGTIRLSYSRGWPCCSRRMPGFYHHPPWQSLLGSGGSSQEPLSNRHAGKRYWPGCFGPQPWNIRLPADPG